MVGKRFGTHRWSQTSSKTLEGSAAFVLSVVASAWLLRVLGIVDSYPVWQYFGAVVFSATLEALSVQNDNLTLPLFLWSILALLDV